MCGIIAYHNKRGVSREALSTVLKSLEQIKHRGIDGEGVLLIDTKTGKQQLLATKGTPGDVHTHTSFDTYEPFSADLVLAHRRLSIIDLSSNGFQPMTDARGNAIIFNGEIYNYVEIKQELEALGHAFKTHSDTEVILAAYAHYGAACFNRFNGMWSIIIWDYALKRIVVCNDRFGVKQLYYHVGDDELMYASEIKAFYPLKKAVQNINHKAVTMFLETSLLDGGNETFFDGVSIFPKSHLQIQDPFSYHKNFSAYWNNAIVVDHSYTEKKAIEEFNVLFSDAVRLRLRADVEVGVALSGGLDSSLVCYYAHDQLKKQNISHQLKSFSVIFPGEAEDESYFSKFIVNNLQLDGKFVNPADNFSFEDLEQLSYHLDYPLQSTSYYSSWNLMRLVSQNGLKVLLEGQGADELFAGYHHHFYKYGRQLVMAGKIRRYMSEVKAFSVYKNRSASEIHKMIINDVKLIAKLKLGLSKETFTKEFVKLADTLNQDFNSAMLPGMLRADDRSSMAFSVESRLPFMDYRMVEFASRLPDHFKINQGWQKYIVRKSANSVPDEIRYRKDKKGFTTPQETWMEIYRKQFEDYAKTNLQNLGLNVNELKKQAGSDSNKLFRIYSLAIWLQVTNQHL